MALPSTTTQTVLFSSQEPAWERGIELTQGQSTRLFTSRAGMEQRQQGRLRSQWRMAYTCIIPASQRRTRDLRNRAELVAPVVVPFWPEQTAVAAMVSNSLTIGRTATEDWFAVGDYLFITNGVDSQFRVVSGYGVSLQQLTLEAITPEIIFGTDAVVYPCRLCIREGGQADQQDENDFSLVEDVRYISL